MMRFGTQSVHNLVWGQRTLTTPVDAGEDNVQRLAVRSWLSMPGQTNGGIGFYRTATGQPLVLPLNGAYAFDTYLTNYAYASGQYSLALEVYLSLVEAMTLADVASFGVSMQVSLAENITVADSTTGVKIGFYALTEAVTLSEALALNTKVSVTLLEGLSLFDSILTNVPLLSYVVNANNFALVKYRNFNFNSFINLGGKYYGVADDGVYELDGDTDDGTAIAASLTLGKSDFNSEMLKSLPAVYIGAKTTGDLILKITVDSGLSYYYTMTAQVSGDLKTNRITPGKGLRSRYWQFELTNVDGGDLTFDSISFHPVELSRRIGG